jgi:hypothetical protein
MNKVYVAYRSFFVDADIIGIFSKEEMAIRRTEDEISEQVKGQEEYGVSNPCRFFVHEFVSDNSGEFIYSKTVFRKEI